MAVAPIVVQYRFLAASSFFRSGGWGCGVTLDTNLVSALRSVKSARNRKLVARHLGWDGRPPCSLQEAGAEFHVTRERARQIYAEALPLLRQSGVPALDAVLSFVQKQSHERVGDVEQKLRRQGMTGERLTLHGVLRAADVFNRKPPFQLHRVGDALVIGPVSKMTDAILNTAVKTVGRHGAAHVPGLCRELSARRARLVDEGLVRRILRTRADIRWLENTGQWFWLTSVSRNRLLTRIQKVLAVQARIRVSKLHQAVSRAYKPLTIPPPVLRSLCAQLSWCRVDGQYVKARTVPRMEEVLSGAESVICGILQDHGEPMPLRRLQESCLAAGVKRENFWRILSFSPVIRRLDREVYGLIGAESAPQKRIRRAG